MGDGTLCLKMNAVGVLARFWYRSKPGQARGLE